jgi:hypothetical protein
MIFHVSLVTALIAAIAAQTFDMITDGSSEGYGMAKSFLMYGSGSRIGAWLVTSKSYAAYVTEVCSDFPSTPPDGLASRIFKVRTHFNQCNDGLEVPVPMVPRTKVWVIRFKLVFAVP